MPLIIMVGVPCAGKTTRAKAIQSYLQEDCKLNVELINEETLGISKCEYYKDPQTEKILRASLKSNVEKLIDQNRVVILDSQNYIKGYRYELYCLARNAQTNVVTIFCDNIIFCDTESEIAQKVCSEGGYDNAFPPALFEDYFGRLERPDPTKRWDNPLISIRFDEVTPYEEIAQTVQSGKKPRDPVSTKAEITFDANFIYELSMDIKIYDGTLKKCITKQCVFTELDKSCQEIINFIMAKQQEVTQGDVIAGLPGCQKKYKVLRVLSPVELKKYKKDFLNLSKLHPPKSKDKFGDAFLEFLNASNAGAAAASE